MSSLYFDHNSRQNTSSKNRSIDKKKRRFYSLEFFPISAFTDKIIYHINQFSFKTSNNTKLFYNNKILGIRPFKNNMKTVLVLYVKHPSEILGDFRNCQIAALCESIT